MRIAAEFFPEFAEKLYEIDTLYAEKRSIGKKTYDLIKPKAAGTVRRGR